LAHAACEAWTPSEAVRHAEHFPASPAPRGGRTLANAEHLQKRRTRVMPNTFPRTTRLASSRLNAGMHRAEDGKCGIAADAIFQVHSTQQKHARRPMKPPHPCLPSSRAPSSQCSLTYDRTSGGAVASCRTLLRRRDGAAIGVFNSARRRVIPNLCSALTLGRSGCVMPNTLAEAGCKQLPSSSATY